MEQESKWAHDKTYLIYSHEHGAWWKPEWDGYTDTVAEAGRYTFEQAAVIVLPTIPSGIEVAVPESVAVARGTAAVYKESAAV